MGTLDPVRRLRLAIISVAALAVLGTAGYHLIERWTILDSLYMTVITLATVGFKEVGPLSVAGKTFTICLIIFGVTVVLWAVASLIEAASGEQVRSALARRRMERQLQALSGHYIICGFGRMGQQIVRDLLTHNVQVCVVEINPEQIPKLVERNIPFVEGNASDDKVLIAAGIKRAAGLVTVAPTDEENVFVTLTARGLNPNLFIVARSILLENEEKLRQAGADRVMSPYVLGGHRMAYSILRPYVAEFWEKAIEPEMLDAMTMLEDVEIGPGAPISGKTIREAQFRQATGATIVAVRTVDGELIPNPGPDQILHAGDVLIVLGEPEQLRRATKLASGG